MFHKTGPGLIEVDSAYTGAGVLKALLYNFDFDDSDPFKHNDLKGEHTRFLTDRVAPLLTGGTGQIWMQGSASRIGDERWNMQLSENRVARVANFLMAQGVNDDQMQLKAVGEELAATHAEDDERDRSVLLWVHPVADDTPRPPRKVPKPLTTRNFKISMVSGLSVTQAINVGKLFRVKIGEEESPSTALYS